MSKINDQQMAIAAVYAKSLLELAQPSGASEDVQSELGDLAKLIEENAELRSFFESPLVDSEQRAKSLEKLFRGKASDLLVDALQVINRNGRLALLPAVAFAFRKQLQTLRNRIDVQVQTAVPLGDVLRDELRVAMERLTGQEVELVEEVDESMLGGMVLRYGDDKVDGSLAHELRGIDLALRERAGHQIHTKFFSQEPAG